MFPIKLRYIYEIFKKNKFELMKTFKDRKINNNNNIGFYLHVFKKK